MTEKEKRSEAARLLSAKGAAKGGRKRAENLTAAERRRIGQMGGRASQARARARRAAARKAAATRRKRAKADRAA